MDVSLRYGERDLVVSLPDARTTVIEPHYAPAAPDPRTVLRAALRSPVAGPPLRECVKPGQSVAISMCDGTRPQPRQLMIPAVLEELDGIVDLDDITILVATGTHRANTDDELRTMLGDLSGVRIVNHDARDASGLVYVGEHGDGVPVWLNRTWVDADVRITTGFVEPHFFAGFSGGPKMVAPGLAGLDTVLTLHDAKRIGHHNATWGVIEGNPVHDDVRAIAAAGGRGTSRRRGRNEFGVTFGFDVVLDQRQQIVAAFGGELFAMHRAACGMAKRTAMRPVPREYDVVVTTNSGFPLDQNLYQSVKGMSAAAQVVSEGGVIVCAAECRDGFPDHGSYREVLASATSPQALLAQIEARPVTVPDQWQVQVQAKIQSRARVVVHTDYLSADDLASAHLGHTTDITETVDRALHAAGSDAAVCVLPDGPQTIPYVNG